MRIESHCYLLIGSISSPWINLLVRGDILVHCVKFLTFEEVQNASSKFQIFIHLEWFVSKQYYLMIFDRYA